METINGISLQSNLTLTLHTSPSLITSYITSPPTHTHISFPHHLLHNITHLRYQGLGRILVAETQVKFLRILGLDLFESIDSDFAYQLNHVEGYLKWGKQKDDKPKRRKKKRKSGNDSNEEVTRFVEYCNWDLDNDEMRKDEDGPRLSVINRNEQSGHIVLVNRVKAWQKKLEDVTDDAMEANDKHYRVLAGASIK